MSQSRQVPVLILGLCVVFGSNARTFGGIFDRLWFVQNELRPVYAPVDSEFQADSGVVQTSHECLEGWTAPPCQRCSGCSRCCSRWELWREHVRCRLRRCHWEHGLDTCYPVCPPYCQPYHGYHPTCWRRLPPYHPCPPAVPNVIVAPEPGPPGMQAPPPAPADFAPAEPSDLVAPPAPGDEFPQ